MTLTEIVSGVRQITEAAQAKFLSDSPPLDESDDAYRNLYKSVCQRMDGTIAMNSTLKVLLIAAVAACPEGEQAKLLEKMNKIAEL